MAQGFDAAKPKFLDPLLSEPMRLNFVALATHHAGAIAPADPQEGWIWLDTSDPLNIRYKTFLNSAWITILNNIQAGAPTQSSVGKYVHTQATGSTSWAVSHGLNTSDVIVQIYDGSNLLILPNSIQITGVNSLTITFLTAKSGRAIVTG